MTSKSKAKRVSQASQNAWPLVRFGDVVHDVKVTIDRDTTEHTRFVAGEHMDSDDIHLRRWGELNGDYLGPAFHRGFRKDQVLYGSRRTYLKKVSVAPFDGICANTTFVLESKDSEVLLPELLPFIMLTDAFTQHSIRESKGSVNPYINWKDIAKYEFFLPPKEDQRSIADVLLSIEAALNEYRNVSDASRELRSTLVEEVISTFGQDTAVPFHELWTESPNSGYSPVPSPIPTGHFTLILSCLTPFGYQQGHLKPVELDERAISCRLEKGDILISRSNTFELVGLAGIFDEERSDVSFPDLMMRLRVNESRIRPKYLEHVLLSRRGRSHMQRVAAGTSGSMKKINRQGLGELQVPLPSLSQQDSLIRLAERTTTAMQSAREHVQSLQKLRKHLIEELLGKLKVGYVH